MQKRDETINPIVNESRNLTQNEYKTWHDWMGKVIHLELWIKFG